MGTPLWDAAESRGRTSNLIAQILVERGALEEICRKEIKAMQWVSVKDRLPASDVLEVITYSPTSGVELVSTSWLTDFENDITHWMPLPEPPKE